MQIDDRIKFSILDSVFKDIIKASGTLIGHIYGKLWLIKPDKHERLSGDNIMIHENNIQCEQ